MDRDQVSNTLKASPLQKPEPLVHSGQSDKLIFDLIRGIGNAAGNLTPPNGYIKR